MKSVTESYLDKELAEMESDAINLPSEFHEWLDKLEPTDEDKDRMAEIYEFAEKPVF